MWVLTWLDNVAVEPPDVPTALPSFQSLRDGQVRRVISTITSARDTVILLCGLEDGVARLRRDHY